MKNEKLLANLKRFFIIKEDVLSEGLYVYISIVKYSNYGDEHVFGDCECSIDDCINYIVENDCTDATHCVNMIFSSEE